MYVAKQELTTTFENILSSELQLFYTAFLDVGKLGEKKIK
jgi:hypothetical protein